ncbi:hypothetical protein L1887_49201 [Cichorium endivia]|nr:hypothetical protein L1887_49201 [Cichorium endivia]
MLRPRRPPSRPAHLSQSASAHRVQYGGGKRCMAARDNIPDTLAGQRSIWPPQQFGVLPRGGLGHQCVSHRKVRYPAVHPSWRFGASAEHGREAVAGRGRVGDQQLVPLLCIVLLPGAAPRWTARGQARNELGDVPGLDQRAWPARRARRTAGSGAHHIHARVCRQDNEAAGNDAQAAASPA